MGPAGLPKVSNGPQPDRGVAVDFDNRGRLGPPHTIHARDIVLRLQRQEHFVSRAILAAEAIGRTLVWGFGLISFPTP